MPFQVLYRSCSSSINYTTLNSARVHSLSITENVCLFRLSCETTVRQLLFPALLLYDHHKTAGMTAARPDDRAPAGQPTVFRVSVARTSPCEATTGSLAPCQSQFGCCTICIVLCALSCMIVTVIACAPGNEARPCRASNRINRTINRINCFHSFHRVQIVTTESTDRHCFTGTHSVANSGWRPAARRARNLATPPATHTVIYRYTRKYVYIYTPHIH